jgi:hypothetical protein
MRRINGKLIVADRSGALCLLAHNPKVAGSNPARDLNLRRGPTGRGCSWPITPERAGACKNLQDVPEQGSRIGLDRPSGGTADPDFPGSAAMCRHCLPPVTPEAAGSSPVDPANINTQ